MKTYKIAAIPADGIGIEVIAAGLEVLDACAAGDGGFQLETTHFDWGSDYYKKNGMMMPADGCAQLRGFDAIYFGAVGAPDVPNHITLWGLRLSICQPFDQYANVRPTRIFPGIKSPLRDVADQDLDWVIVRENSEGEYAGQGGRSHRGLPEEVGTEVSIFTRAGVTRIMRYAFRLARSRPRKLLTVVTKSNAQRHGMVMWDEIAAEVAREFPDVTWDKMLVDAMTARMILKPGTLDTVVATNLHADILSDLAAALAGSLGIAPTANLNPERKFPSMFEPIHGSAFDITGKGIANPIGTFWSGVMMLEHLGEKKAAARLMSAIEVTLADKANHGPDLGGKANTRQVTDAVKAALQNNAAPSQPIHAHSRNLLQSVFEAAVAAADPLRAVPPFLPAPPVRGRTIVVGAGKAAAAMARAVEDHWQGPLSGLVVTRYGHGLPTTRIEVVEASHPVPDAAGMAAAGRIRDLVTGLTPDDLVLCLISGGGSALLALPAPGISLEDKQAIGRRLLKSGANIREFNCVRKHLSAIKGGRLAEAAAPARVVTLLISDVPGDDPSVIGSGPTVPDPSTREDALAVLQKYGVELPAAVADHLRSPAAETPKPGAACFDGNEVHLIATPQQALEAAAAEARRQGVPAIILGNDIEGEARDVALVHAGIARQIAAHGQPHPAPCLVLSGGETSVTVRGAGRGGRNAEFLLALGVALDGHPGIHAIACDTDGIDGVEDNAGAVLSPDTLRRADALGVKATALLADNDAYAFFAALGDLVVTGPTRTNVNDFRAILVRADE